MRGEEVFLLAQSQGLPWSPIRRPEENLRDPHFDSRRSFTTIAHPELGRELLYPGTVAGDGSAPHMKYTRRAPHLRVSIRARSSCKDQASHAQRSMTSRARNVIMDNPGVSVDGTHKKKFNDTHPCRLDGVGQPPDRSDERLSHTRIRREFHWSRRRDVAHEIRARTSDEIKQAGAGNQMRYQASARGGVSAIFISVNRNKRSVVLDLKRPGAIDVFYRIARTCDVIVQNFRPGVVEHLKLGYKDVGQLSRGHHLRLGQRLRTARSVRAAACVRYRHSGRRRGCQFPARSGYAHSSAGSQRHRR